MRYQANTGAARPVSKRLQVWVLLVLEAALVLFYFINLESLIVGNFK